ncbi:MAG: V-type ATPase subunit [Clostridiales bacterium]|nr:V-type ATPase subunit [Clostridiales bacterium]
MSKKIKDTDYLFLSARIRALENGLLTRSRMERMLEASTNEEAAKVLTECGYEELTVVDVDAVNRMLAHARDEVIADVTQFVPDRRLVDVFKIKYDYHNAKVLLKSEARGTDASRLLVDTGRVPGVALAKALAEGELSDLPKPLAQAMLEARGLLASTKDPQQADFLLDQAYFREMADMAAETGSSFLEGYVALMVDAANLRSLVRVRRMGKDSDFLKTVLFRGGSVPPERVTAAADGSAELEQIYGSGLLAEAAALGQTAAQGGSLTAFEKACDNAQAAYLSTARQVAFGEQPVIAYLAARDNEFTAIRIIMTGRLAGLPVSVIQERLRDVYV